MDTDTKQNKGSLSCAVRHKGTSAHATREQPMDTAPYRVTVWQNAATYGRNSAATFCVVW